MIVHCDDMTVMSQLTKIMTGFVIIDRIITLALVKNKAIGSATWCTFPMNPHVCLLAGWSVDRYLFPIKAGKLYF